MYYSTINVTPYLLLSTLALLVGISAVHAEDEIIVSYNFTNSNYSASDSSSNVTPEDFKLESLNDSTSNFGISNSAGNVYARSADIESYTTTLPNYFISFKISPNAGHTLSLSELSFDALHNVTSGGANNALEGYSMRFYVRSSIDSYAADLVATNSNHLSVQYNASQNITFQLTGLTDFQNLNSDVTFRFYVGEKNDNGETLDISTVQGARWDDVVLKGTTDVIPELSAYSLILGCLSLTVMLSRRPKHSM